MVRWLQKKVACWWRKWSAGAPLWGCSQCPTRIERQVIVSLRSVEDTQYITRKYHNYH